MFETYTKELRPTPKQKKEKAKNSSDLCSFETNFFMSLKKHKIQVHKEKLLTCIYCIFKAKDLETLQSHSQSHNSTNVFEMLQLSNPPQHAVKLELE